MPRNLVVDHNILGWAEKRKEAILKTYGQIFRVGIGYELPRRSSDKEVAVFCKENDCDLITADNTAYTNYFEAGIGEVNISRYNWDAKGDIPIFLIRIVK